MHLLMKQRNHLHIKINLFKCFQVITTSYVAASVSLKELTRVINKSYELLYVLRHELPFLVNVGNRDYGLGIFLLHYSNSGIDALWSKCFYFKTCKNF